MADDTPPSPASTPKPSEGAASHHRALERLYRSAPVNTLFASELAIEGEGRARISFDITEDVVHAAGAAHGTVYFKMLDDAAFYAANTLVTDRFLLTTS
ncbi:MAG: thioesterase, partial [Pseudomonadota bacterium]|nr:thioesterase [Pseudomonadota bacterium]